MTRDRGQSAVVVLLVSAALFVASAAGAVALGRRVIDRGRAHTAADAAALAALEGGPAAAGRLADRNGAELLEVMMGPGPDEVTVVVRVGGMTATARASDAP